MSWTGKFDVALPVCQLHCNTEQKIAHLRDYINDCERPYGVPLSECQSDREKIDAIIYNTTYFHEARHVHDHLLSPVLNYIYRLKLLAVLHAAQLLLKWDCQDINIFNTLPIPLQKWIRLSLNQKNEYLNDWMTTNSQVRVSMMTINPNIPIRDKTEDTDFLSRLDDISKLMVYAAGYFEEYSNIQKPRYDYYGRELSIRTILEASAISTQLASAELHYGYEDTEYFKNTLVNLSANEAKWRSFANEPFYKRKKLFSNYTVILSYVNSYLKYNKSIGAENLFIFINYLLFWSLSGNLLAVNAISNPSVRLHEFLENDFGKGIAINEIEADPLGVFEFWDKKLGSESINYHDYFTCNRYIYSDLSEKFDSLGLTTVADYVKMISDSSQMMVSLFFKNPSYYLNPYYYISNLYKYINVPLRFVLDKPINMSCIDETRIELDDKLLNMNFSEKDDVVKSVTTDTPVLKMFGTEKFTISEYKVISYKKSEDYKIWSDMIEPMFKIDTESGEILNELIKGGTIKYIL